MTYLSPYIVHTRAGHAFGGGAFLALAHEYRIMRRDRGWWCVPAATVGLQFPLPDGLISLLQSVSNAQCLLCCTLLLMMLGMCL